MSGAKKWLSKGIPFSGEHSLSKMLLNPDQPKLPEAPAPPPTIDDAVANQQAADKRRRRKGYAATVLTSPTGVGSSPVGSKPLLGS